MVSGLDRYYQIAKFLRDEDLRSDRQPEFTQIDIETAFLNEPAIMTITESMTKYRQFKVGIGRKLTRGAPLFCLR